MSEIHFERQHALGLTAAREVAQAWMEQARERWGLAFEHHPWTGDAAADGATDRITFQGMGADGSVQVSSRHFDVRMTLGGLMAAFAPMVEEKMARKLDELLVQQGPASAAAG